MKIYKIKNIIFSGILLFQVSSFAKDDVLNFYNEITKKCSEGKSNFQQDLIKLDEKIRENVKDLSKEKIEAIFREENLLSDIYSYLGTDLLDDESSLRGLRACGKHYAQFIKSFKEKMDANGEEAFGAWQSCLESDYKEVIPDIPKKIISCYDSRAPSQVKSYKK